jgi:linearmycin/streptolysin S transport system permease protein
VDENKAAAVIIIPAGFTESIIPPEGQAAPKNVVQVEMYTNPTTPTSVGVIQTILDEFMSQVEVGQVSGRVIATQLIASGRLQIQQAQEIALTTGTNQADAAAQSTSIILNNVTPSGETVKFDILGVLAPSMALMFLMYAVSYGGRTLLTERNQGTLPRLLVSPTTPTQVLGGKMIGIFLTGTAQMLILILGTTVLFQLQWGDPLAVLVLVLAAVFGAVGWGLLITAMAKTPGQVSAIGSAIMLVFGILGGGFINVENMPAWFRLVTKISPNAWGMDGFSTLALGGNLGSIQTPILALVGMGLLLFVVAVLLFGRRGLTEK